ncbi:MAG: methyltransferase domain-containing protein [Chloroflexi bacterium]|nr:methyltransferase domain-containing protein [Chloroflexota bacterium]
MSDTEIGTLFGISFHQLQQIITEACGANISIVGRPKQIKSWAPKSFREETTTVWSFKQRGDWATHDGRYRGNWSPYIPRNVILKYSKPGDVVLDYFAGSGTTAVEAKLLGRRCIARDINPAAVALTIENLAFEPYPGLFAGQQVYEPQISIGDARDLSDIPSDSIDLICAHPPYAGIINYSSAVPGDLSRLSTADFLREMSKVAHESWRILKPGGKCAILVGDARKRKHVVPIGFQLIRVFLEAGFVLCELVIKRQHNCRATGFWYARSIQHNFLLLAHEYLPVFEKPSVQLVSEQGLLWEHYLNHAIVVEHSHIEEKDLETTSVWVLPEDHLELEIKRNLLQRFSKHKEPFIEIKFDDNSAGLDNVPDRGVPLVYVRFPEKGLKEQTALGYRATIKNVITQLQAKLAPDGFVVFEVKDFRCDDGKVYPLGLFLYEDLAHQENLSLKEIVIVVPNSYKAFPQSSKALAIIHRYLLIFTAKRDK